MIENISIFLFGGMTISIPLIIWYLQSIGTKHIVNISKIESNLLQTVEGLNKLHNEGATAFKNQEARLQKLEALIAAKEYEKSVGRRV